MPYKFQHDNYMNVLMGKPKHPRATCRHSERRAHSDGLCISCEKYKKLKENLPRLKHSRQRGKEYNWKSFGGTHEMWESLYDKQNGCCAVCHKHESELPTRRTKGPTLVFDHDDQTMTPRGLLCWNCNVAVGFIEKTPLQPIVDYLKSYGRTYQG